MSLTKRGRTWWISYTTPSGQRIRCSARTEDKKAAQELHDKLKAESWRIEQLAPEKFGSYAMIVDNMLGSTISTQESNHPVAISN